MRITSYGNGAAIAKEIAVHDLPDDLLATLRYNTIREVTGVAGASEPCLDVELDDDREQALLLDRLMEGMSSQQQDKFLESPLGEQFGLRR